MQAFFKNICTKNRKIPFLLVPRRQTKYNKSKCAAIFRLTGGAADQNGKADFFMGLMDKRTLLVWLLRALVMLVAIPVHEAAHALVSAKLGDTTAKDRGRLTLNPMAHFDLLGALCMIFTGIGWAKPVPTYASRFKNPKAGMALTAAAGPAANLLVAFVAVLLYKILYYTLPASAAINFLLLFLEYMASINTMLAVFNLLPVPPFDGSRIVTVFLPRHTYFKLMQYERYIFIAVFLLLFLGFLDGPLYRLNSLVWDGLMWATSFVDRAVFALAGVSV